MFHAYQKKYMVKRFSRIYCYQFIRVFLAVVYGFWLCGLWGMGVSLVEVHGLSHPVAGGILVPHPGVNAALEAWSLKHWTSRKLSQFIVLIIY